GGHMMTNRGRPARLVAIAFCLALAAPTGAQQVLGAGDIDPSFTPWVVKRNSTILNIFMQPQHPGGNYLARGSAIGSPFPLQFGFTTDSRPAPGYGTSGVLVDSNGPAYSQGGDYKGSESGKHTRTVN